MNTYIETLYKELEEAKLVESNNKKFFEIAIMYDPYYKKLDTRNIETRYHNSIERVKRLEKIIHEKEQELKGGDDNADEFSRLKF